MEVIKDIVPRDYYNKQKVNINNNIPAATKQAKFMAIQKLYLQQLNKSKEILKRREKFNIEYDRKHKH